MNKYGRQINTSAFEVSNLNSIGINIGDRVEASLKYEIEEDGRFLWTRKVIGEVAEIDCKGRWFRIVNNKGISVCCHFANTYDNGRKFKYRILEKRKG